MTAEKKRIAILINTLSVGGAERAVSNLSLRFAERYDVDILVNDDQRIDFPYSGRIISLGLPSGKNRAGVYYQVRAFCRRIFLLRKLQRERNYAAVLSFSEMTNFSNVLAMNDGSGKNGKVIISVHNSIKKTIQRNWKYKFFAKYILSFCMKKADYTVSCSREIENELIEKYGLSAEKSTVIRNGIDLKKIKKLSGVGDLVEKIDSTPGLLLYAVEWKSPTKSMPNSNIV